MGFKILNDLPSPESIKKEFPLSTVLKEKKKLFDNELKNIICGKSNKFILIIGPCSADNEDAVLEYCLKLRQVQDKIKDKIFIIPRIYTGKPRTTGEGYKGLLHQPNIKADENIKNGIIAIRKMHLKIIEESGFFTADEMLYLYNLSYIDDLVSYIAVGARSVENQEHRLYASAFDVPVGMKNPTSGDLSVMINSIYSARLEHRFNFTNKEVLSSGNTLSHAILRGSINQNGRNIPNYHYEDIYKVISMYKEKDLENPCIIVDTNHANSNKNHKEQIRIAKEVLYLRKTSKEINDFVKGLMIESYLEEGSQDMQAKVYGKSITDPCLSFYDSEKLLYEIYELL